MSAAVDGPLYYASLVEVGAAIAAGATSSVAVTEAMLARIAAVDPSLHSFLAVTAESALAEAAAVDTEIRAGLRRGPLHGVPIALKDLFETRGAPTSFGSPAYGRSPGREDATAVRRLRRAGAVILGRLHLHEGAFGGHHPALGRCLNPWNADYWPGGSSSGSGAATAAGLCFGSLGTDTGGSIRFPSAANGLTGLKPTWGRTSRRGVLPLAESLDTVGPMARSAADAAALFDALAGFDPRDPTSLPDPVPDHLGDLLGSLGARGLRVGFDEAGLEAGTDRETAAAVRAAAAVLDDLGAAIVPVTVPDRADAAAAQIAITEAECARFHRPVFEADAALFGPELAGAVSRGLSADAPTLASAYIARDRFKGRLGRLFSAVDALLFPVTRAAGTRYDAFGEALADLPSFLAFTAPFNLSGSPSVTLPCGIAASGLPIGVQLIGPHLSEPVLLRAAHAVQQVTDWHRRRPPGF